MLKRRNTALCLGVSVLLLQSCAIQRAPVASGQPCSTDAFTLEDNFAGARRGDCTIFSKRSARLVITPEDSGEINDSPWYAFKVIPHAPGTLRITLAYEGGHHRYWPKTSLDGHTWQAVDPRQVDVYRSGKKVKVKLKVDERPVLVAAQELVLPQQMLRWSQALAERTDAGLSLLGHSSENRPIPLLKTDIPHEDVIVLVGRQHPPEVTGSYGLRGFVDALFEDTGVARRFRQQFGIIIIPMLNPDGVIRGHWRHNVHGTDLNRDWGPFTQVETRLIKERIDKLVDDGKHIRLFLDFHSTKRNVFYTQSDEDVTVPLNFAGRWLDAARARVQNYPFEHAKRHNRGLPTSKNYMYARFGIPAITYEVDDKTGRAPARAAARIFAEEMMHLMLSNDD